MSEFRMPSLGADMDEGTLAQWLVHPGDKVTRGDIVAIVETAKSAIEVECFDSGRIDALLVEEGTSVPVGTPLAVIAASADERPRTAPVTAPDTTPVTTPDTAPVTTPVTTPLVRRIAEDRHVDLTAVHGSGPGGRITRADVEGPEARRTPTPGSKATAPGRQPASAPSAGGPAARVKASPLARRLAAELGVDLAEVTGTGRDGTVRADDVRATASPARRPSQVAQAARATQPPPALPNAARAATARLMSRSKREIPHFYLSTTVDMTAALDWMHARNRELPLSARLVPAALMFKAVALAAREVPDLNGHWIDDAFAPADEVRLGIAVSLRDGGLVAPALAHADTLSVAEVMAAVKDLVARARRGRLRSSETADPSITVTNLGDQGVEAVFGVVYPPQVALVGLGRIVERPVAVDGLLGVRPLVTATLSADHRAADGATGARLLTALDRLLQHPEEL
ncbi:2-oxo acid dehydrogenase subunit E2 [Streptomyces sp. NPDC048623]|uniref:2-oxo acid dehydrogenase subunit E2 n=1 Tax=Streptomyces sp. NPDC048623 TaxID=3155761 RepID=UPI003429784B